MLQVCRKRADETGLTSRCTFHEGYVDSLPAVQVYNAATCFLVSQFILEKEARRLSFSDVRSNRLRWHCNDSDPPQRA